MCSVYAQELGTARPSFTSNALADAQGAEIEESIIDTAASMYSGKWCSAFIKIEATFFV